MREAGVEAADSGSAKSNTDRHMVHILSMDITFLVRLIICAILPYMGVGRNCFMTAVPAPQANVLASATNSTRPSPVIVAPLIPLR